MKIYSYTIYLHMKSGSIQEFQLKTTTTPVEVLAELVKHEISQRTTRIDITEQA